MTDSKSNYRIHPLAAAIAATVATLTTLVTPAWAQSEGLMLEEVVVTAQKRDQSAQDVPSSVSVISESMLRDYNMQDFSELEQLTPGLVLETKSARAGSIALRGIDYNPNSAAEQAVDVYWNDTPVRGGGGVFQSIFDLQRIEVLKGPQGTLQGRSSPAGAIMLHTAKPNLDEMEGYISAQGADNDGFNTNGAVSVPIIPGKLAVRLAGVYDESDVDQGENIVTGNDTHKETTAGRVSVTWLASDTVSVDFAYQYLNNEATDFNFLQGTSLQDPTLPTLDHSDRKGIQVTDDETDADYQRASLNVAWEFGNHELTWLTGWSDVDSTVDGQNVNSEGIQDPAEGQPQTFEDDSDFLSQELRLTNTDGEMWEYMFGLYYGDSDAKFNRHDVRIGDVPGLDRVIRTHQTIESYAAFTHHIFHLSEAWTAQLGLRWGTQEIDIESPIYAGPRGFGGLPEGTFISDLIPEEFQNRDDDSVTGAINLQYHFNDPDVMVYGSFGTGYRPGGVTVASVPLGDLVSFDEEDSWSAELGFKSTLLDGRATLNGAVFYQEFSDYIARLARISVATSPNTTGVTDNADAEVTGAELDFNMLLTENWQLGGGVSYANAEFSNGEELVCNVLDADGDPVIPPGDIAATCDVGGQALGPQPEWQVSLNSEYTLPFASYEGYLRGLYKYNGDRDDEDIDDLDAYQTVDLFLGVRAQSGTWDVGLFARNLFDEEEIIRAGAPGLHRKQPTGYQAVDVVPQRLVGLKASYNF
jgi:iron complex outermembrane receptor protein